jgi:hypothetical protein
MRKYILILLCILIVSCKTQKATLSPFVIVYKENGDNHNIYPSYMLLRTQPKIFEMYAPGVYASITGEWNIANDTLCIFPKFEYYASENKMHMHEINSADSSVVSIQQQYLIKNDCLIDITNYSIILPEIFNKQNCKALYKRVKNQ